MLLGLRRIQSIIIRLIHIKHYYYYLCIIMIYSFKQYMTTITEHNLQLMTLINITFIYLEIYIHENFPIVNINNK